MVETWRALGLEQRVAAVGALLLAVSTIGPFSFVEAAQLLVVLGVLLLLYKRAQGRQFHLPFGDGTAILVAGIWAALLITARMLDRPFGQNMLALVCAAILVAAGLRLRIKQGPPPDDEDEEIEWEDAPTAVVRRRPRRSAAQAEPARSDPADAKTEPLPPPEFEPPRGG